MRRKFPWFWVPQFLALTILGLVSLLHPGLLLEYFRGYLTPKKVEYPSTALNYWVLGLQEIDPPSDLVRTLFTNHDETLHKARHIWSPDDPSLEEFVRPHGATEWQTPETLNTAWEEFQSWLLSSRPPPPPEHRAAIEKWIRAIDQIPEPTPELARWVAELKTTESPPRDLRILMLEGDQVLPEAWRLAVGQIRLASPCILAAAFFTLLGMLTPHIRRPLARVFVLLCMFWSVSQLDSSLQDQDWSFGNAVTALGLCLGIVIVVRMLRAAPRLTAGSILFAVIAGWWLMSFIASLTADIQDSVHVWVRINLTFASGMVATIGTVNAWYWLIGKSEDPPQDNGGIVQRRPPQLWTLWVVQFLILFVTGVITLLFPERLAELFIRERFDHLTTDVVNDSVRFLGTWIISMSLFSFFALGVGRDWVWQGISVVFCIAFGLLALSTIHLVSTGVYSLWICFYGLQGVVFIPLTIILLRNSDRLSKAMVERMQSDDWNLPDLLLAPFLMWVPAVRGRRAFYRDGVGANGYLKVLPTVGAKTADGCTVPPNAYFTPERRLPIQVRFSNCTQSDDASLDIRGCALRIGSGPVDRLDLFFSTGEFAPFSTLFEFQRFLRCANYQKLIERCQKFREGVAAGLRRAPASFTRLDYHHKFVLEWGTPDAEWYLARFRLVPRPVAEPVAAAASTAASGLTAPQAQADRAREQGFPDDDDLMALWRQERRDNETRSTNYLRQELHDRLQSAELQGAGQVAFQLEVQFHSPQPGDTLDWYDASVEWETRESPWLPLAEIVLESAQSAYQCERQMFNPSRLPLSLSVPRPARLTDLNDPRALAASRNRITRVVTYLRTWRNRFRSTVAARKAAAQKASAT